MHLHDHELLRPVVRAGCCYFLFRYLKVITIIKELQCRTWVLWAMTTLILTGWASASGVLASKSSKSRRISLGHGFRRSKCTTILLRLRAAIRCRSRILYVTAESLFTTLNGPVQGQWSFLGFPREQQGYVTTQGYLVHTASHEPSAQWVRTPTFK